MVAHGPSKSEAWVRLPSSAQCEYSTTVSASVYQIEDASSILVIRSHGDALGVGTQPALRLVHYSDKAEKSNC